MASSILCSTISAKKKTGIEDGVLTDVAIPLEQGRFFNSEVCFSFLFLGY